MGLITHFVTYFLLVHGYALFLAFSAIFLQKTSFLVSKFTVFENQRLCAPKIWQNCPIIACKIYSPWNVDDFRFLKLPKMLSGLRDMPIFIKVGVFAEIFFLHFWGRISGSMGPFGKQRMTETLFITFLTSLCEFGSNCPNIFGHIDQIFLAKINVYIYTIKFNFFHYSLMLYIIFKNFSRRMQWDYS